MKARGRTTGPLWGPGSSRSLQCWVRWGWQFGAGPDRGLNRAQLTVEPQTPRDCVEVGLVVRGVTNAEIALSAGLSASTVKHYVETAMRKAGVTSRVSLAMWLRDHEEGAG